MEEGSQPEHEEEAEEDEQDHAHQLEPGKVQRHHQQVERQDGQEEHAQQVLRRPEPIQLGHASAAPRGRLPPAGLVVVTVTGSSVGS